MEAGRQAGRQVAMAAYGSLYVWGDITDGDVSEVAAVRGKSITNLTAYGERVAALTHDQRVHWISGGIPVSSKQSYCACRGVLQVALADACGGSCCVFVCVDFAQDNDEVIQQTSTSMTATAVWLGSYGTITIDNERCQ